MTEKTVSTKKAPVAKTVSKKAPARKPAAKKAAPKKAAPKKSVARKVAPQKTAFEQFENSVFAIPFKVANKTFMAGLGVAAFVGGELDKQYKEFDKRFTKYAKDGEKVFDKFEGRVEGIRKDVEKKVDGAYDRVRETLKKAA